MVKMADMKLFTQFVWKKKDAYSISLSKVQPSMANKIKEYIWPEYNEEFIVCPDVICSNCRKNIFLLEEKHPN